MVSLENIRTTVVDTKYTYRQRVAALANLAENLLDPPPVRKQCSDALSSRIICDMYEGNAPYRPRYLLPEYQKVLINGSLFLELPPAKDLDDECHIALTGNSNKTVLESIRYLNSIKKLYEVRLLLIPGQNDSDHQLIETVTWLKNINPDMSIKVNAFNSHGVRAQARRWPNVSDLDLARYHSILN